MDEQQIDKKEYFNSLLLLARQEDMLTADRLQQIQGELFELLKKKAEAFTNGESTSITIDRAEQFFASIHYTIGVYLESLTLEEKVKALKDEALDYMYQKGFRKIREMVKEAKQILEDIQAMRFETGNIAFQDTLNKGLPAFFRDYNPEFKAHEDAGSIDYPLANVISDQTGITFLASYLKALKTETMFVRQFDNAVVENLLASYDEEYKDDLFNIYELVLMNAVGCELIEGDEKKLTIDAEERAVLTHQLTGKNTVELTAMLCNAYDRLAGRLDLKDAEKEEQKAYAYRTLSKAVMPLSDALKQNRLESIFLEIKKREKKQKPVLAQGKEMEDEKLRDLIEEIRDMRYVSDKIALIRRNVNNLDDMAELLDTCFFGNEFRAVYAMLHELELAYLWEITRDEEEKILNHQAIELKEWQKSLLSYVGALPDNKRKAILILMS
ncbi:MAG: hypothetical protein E7256_11255 [Lachnospiraceae bacterium]|nr:hypothetical protein [Lachnospiraceae bacterium]